MHYVNGIRRCLYGMIDLKLIGDRWFLESNAEYGLDGKISYYGIFTDEYIATQVRFEDEIFVIEAPFYTYAPLFGSETSQTSLNTVDLNLGSLDVNLPLGYCFGHDWFNSGKAPYPVFRVSDNQEVKPDD